MASSALYENEEEGGGGVKKLRDVGSSGMWNISKRQRTREGGG